MSELPQLYDRALGAYLGLAIGDALGATVEFMTPREIRHRIGVHRDMVGGGWLKLPPGRVTDDTTMALALGDGLLQGQRRHGAFSMDCVADSFVAWWRGKPVDCGNTCRRGIVRYLREGSLAGTPCDGDGGNGALMRNLPVVLANLHDQAAMCEQSLAQSHFTHHHPLSDAAVLAFARMTRALILGCSPTAAQALAEALVQEQPAFRWLPYPGRASGYVVDTVQTVLYHVLSHWQFEDALIATVNRGDDADTTGALVGMLAGAACGAHALPSVWLRRLERDTVRAITEQTSDLLALAARSPASLEDAHA
jgi:ADP-ribosyl-[dinitrogen reductase] hydrolase